MDATAALVLLLCAQASLGPATSVNGYASSRSQFNRARVEGLLPVTDVAQLEELVEANVQLKHSFAERAFVYGDLSLFLRAAGNFRSLGPDGQEQVEPAHDVPAHRPLTSLNELYVSVDVVPELNLLAGKKRLVWGAGFAFNPTDLLNPPKDPTDPSLQRAGAYMARVEVPLENLAFTFVASPQVLRQANGLPYALLYYPSYDAPDDEAHFLLAARAYALVADADVNVMLFYGNRYNDDFEDKLRAGVSFSRYFFTDYELHVEALLQQGSARRYPNPACTPDALAAFLCARFGTPLLEQGRLDDSAFLPRILVGTRRMFDDESMLSIEYLFQADGYTRAELQRYVDLLEVVKQARQTLPVNPFAASGGTDSGIPQRFAFEPLGRHHLFLSYSKPKIANDWTVGAVVIASLTDLSTLVSPSVSWSAAEWLTLSASAFIPLPGPRALAAQSSAGGYFGEQTLAPFLYRALFEARAFY